VQLLRSIVKEAPRQIGLLDQQQAASSVALYTRQAADAQKLIARTTKDLGKYMQDHGISPGQMAAQALFDPKFAALYQAVESAQVDLHNAQQQLSQVGSSNAAQSTIVVYDPPAAQTAAISKKTLALDGGIGLLVGLLLSGVFVVLTTARDHSVRYADEVPELVGLTVLASLPYSEDLARRRGAARAAPDGRRAASGGGR
jgi:hypothetical protein